ncbi:hypothetical protein UY3_17996, partial [Chelonia mydas]
VPQLLYGGKLDFLVFDYLSEITMSLLTAAKAKSPDLGYTPDFVLTAMGPYIKDIHRKGVRVISNAGGMNPLACAAGLQEVAKKADVDLKIAVVAGDDLMGEKDNLKGAGITDMESGKPFPENIHSMNAYLGLAGHLIECGAQCTGGIFTDWHTIPDWHNMGFPIVECSSDGHFTLSKPPDTGGLISFGTVAEQLVYEIGNPQHYLLPDVTCDFSQVSITEIPGIEGGAVKIHGAKGSPPSTFYKANATYLDGFRATAVCPVVGPKAVEKGRQTAESILKRTRLIFSQLGYEDYCAVNIQILGSEDTYGPHAKKKVDDGPREAVIWLAVHHKQKKAVEIFSREIAPAGTGMAPGLTAVVGGRPRVYELPGIHGLNFVLKNSLGGGGIASLRSDPQGETWVSSASGLGRASLFCAESRARDFWAQGCSHLLGSDGVGMKRCLFGKGKRPAGKAVALLYPSKGASLAACSEDVDACRGTPHAGSTTESALKMHSKSAGSARAIGDRFIATRLDPINRSPNTLPVDSRTPARQRRKRSTRRCPHGRPVVFPDKQEIIDRCKCKWFCKGIKCTITCHCHYDFLSSVHCAV